MSYEMIDRYLRNSLDDDAYAEYSEALDEMLHVVRLKALEDCLNEIEGWANDQFELKAAIRALKGEV